MIIIAATHAAAAAVVTAAPLITDGGISIDKSAALTPGKRGWMAVASSVIVAGVSSFCTTLPASSRDAALTEKATAAAASNSTRRRAACDACDGARGHHAQNLHVRRILAHHSRQRQGKALLLRGGDGGNARWCRQSQWPR